MLQVFDTVQNCSEDMSVEWLDVLLPKNLQVTIDKPLTSTEETVLEDNLNEWRHQWKMNGMEDKINGR